MRNRPLPRPLHFLRERSCRERYLLAASDLAVVAVPKILTHTQLLERFAVILGLRRRLLDRIIATSGQDLDEVMRQS